MVYNRTGGQAWLLGEKDAKYTLAWWLGGTLRVKDLLKILLAVFALLMLGTLSMALDISFGAPQAAGSRPTATPIAPPLWLPGAAPAQQVAVPTPVVPPYPFEGQPSAPAQLPTPALWPYPYPQPATVLPMEGQASVVAPPTPAPLATPWR